MKKDESNVSKKFKMVLVWQSEETKEDGTKVYRFLDEKTGDCFIHYQIKPGKCSNPTSAKMARAFVTKMKKYEIGNRLRVEAVFRQMADGCVYRDVESVLYRMPTK